MAVKMYVAAVVTPVAMTLTTPDFDSPCAKLG
jgi:hypothetical protein